MHVFHDFVVLNIFGITRSNFPPKLAQGKEKQQWSRRNERHKGFTDQLTHPKHSKYRKIDSRQMNMRPLDENESKGPPHHFFLLAAAWVGPGRNALQSAEQKRQRRYGHKHHMM